jgi:hypothetical protein
VGAGYLLGMVGGSAVSDTPSGFIIAAVGLLACWLIFRQGRNSQSHAAADAISAAIVDANARAQAVAHQTVTVAQGHVVQNTTERGELQLSSRPNLPRYVGVDAITGNELYELDGTLYRYDELPFEHTQRELAP